MLCGWRITVLLLLLLLLVAGTEAQSGDGDTDMEPRIRCTSHISTTSGCILSCKLLGGQSDSEDDEDGGGDGIEKMRLCYRDLRDRTKCLEGDGDEISSTHLTPLLDLNLIVHLKTGGNTSMRVDLTKIVKPRSPWVWNVTFDQESNQAVIRILSPYHGTNDYLRVDNQIFELHIYTTGSSLMQNISSKDVLQIDMQHLQKQAKYRVKVRALPQTFQGFWSEWSEPFGFETPPEKKVPNKAMTAYTLTVSLSVVTLTFIIVVFWKNKIFTYIWPSIPHPKQTLVQICRPNKGLLLNLKPEVFSALKVYPLEPSAPSVSLAAAAGPQSSDPCSDQSSACRSTTSVSTEELELSALLSQSSSDGTDSLPDTGPSPVGELQLGDRASTPQPEQHDGGNEVEVFGPSQQDEAYVTMSSFYQIK